MAPAIGTLDNGWVNLFPTGKLGKAMRTECVVAGQKLGLMSVIIIGFLTDATDEQFTGDAGEGVQLL